MTFMSLFKHSEDCQPAFKLLNWYHDHFVGQLIEITAISVISSIKLSAAHPTPTLLDGI